MLRAEGISKAGKSDLIGLVIQKVMLPNKDVKRLTVTIEWLK